VRLFPSVDVQVRREQATGAASGPDLILSHLILSRTEHDP